MTAFFKKITSALKILFFYLLSLGIAASVGYLIGNKTLDRDSLEDEIRAEVEPQIRQNLEYEYNARLNQINSEDKQQIDNLVDAFISDIEADIKGIDTKKTLEPMNEEKEFGL